MKQGLLAIVFLGSAWMILVSGYTLLECRLHDQGLGPLSTFPYRESLIQAFNLAFPLAVGALVWLMKVSGSLGIQPEVFRLCLITVVLGAFLGFRAKERAYPDPSDPEIAKAIWWLPDPPAFQVQKIDEW